MAQLDHLDQKIPHPTDTTSEDSFIEPNSHIISAKNLYGITRKRFDEIFNTPTVSETEILHHIQQGDTIMREYFIRSKMPIVARIVNSISHSPLEYDDAFQSWLIGLNEAIDAYTETLGASFMTLARIKIKGSIIDAQRYEMRTRNLNVKSRKFSTIAKERAVYIQKNFGKKPWLKKLMEITGFSEFVIRAYILRPFSVSLWSIPCNKEDDSKEEDIEGKISIIKTDATLEMAERHEHIEHLDTIKDTIKFKPNELEVIGHYYGLWDDPPKNLKEIAVMLNRTEWRICQIHAAALKRLRDAFAEYEK